MVLHFNTMERLYSGAIRDLLDGIDGAHSPGTLLDPNSRLMLQGWPLKFQNYAVIYMPRGSPLMIAVHWDTLRGAFGREIAPSAALLLTDRHLVVIAEEKSFSPIRIPTRRQVWWDYRLHSAAAIGTLRYNRTTPRP